VIAITEARFGWAGVPISIRWEKPHLLYALERLIIPRKST